MTRLSDAAAINAAAGPHWESIQPEWDEKAERGECADEDYGDGPRDLGAVCGGEFDMEPTDLGAINLGAVTAVFLACLIGTCLLILAVMGGRSVMCKVHANDPTPIAYCEQVAR